MGRITESIQLSVSPAGTSLKSHQCSACSAASPGLKPRIGPKVSSASECTSVNSSKLQPESGYFAPFSRLTFLHKQITIAEVCPYRDGFPPSTPCWKCWLLSIFIALWRKGGPPGTGSGVLQPNAVVTQRSRTKMMPSVLVSDTHGRSGFSSASRISSNLSIVDNECQRFLLTQQSQVSTCFLTEQIWVSCCFSIMTGKATTSDIFAILRHIPTMDTRMSTDN
jgi:hypothetical protein